MLRAHLAAGADLAELAAERASGITPRQWWREHEAEVEALFASGKFPRLASVSGGPPENLDALFEHVLRRHLAGIEARLRRS